MRVKEDLRRSVVFLGYGPPDSGPEDFTPIGTAFFLRYQGFPYFVTAGHVARELGGDPFLLRVNKRDGGSENLHADAVDWVFHDDRNVDIAVLPGNPSGDYDFVLLGEDFLMTEERIKDHEIGAGDDVFIVGLYRLLYGKKRNMPIVHSGSIALMAEDEPIPVKDNEGDKTYYVNAFLVEAHTLSGLSGSPVFVDKTLRSKMRDGQVIRAPSYTSLLGVWQAAWDAPPGEVLSLERPKDITVPVGMGLVVPAYRIIEVLEKEELQQEREHLREKFSRERAATLQSAPPATDENHKDHPFRHPLSSKR